MGQTDGKATDSMGMSAIKGDLILNGVALSDVTRKLCRNDSRVPA